MSATGSKRSIDHKFKVNKRVKSFTDENNLPNFAEKVKRQILKLSRSEISELVSRNLAQLLSSQSQLGDLRRLCDTYEEAIERWKQKAGQLEGMCQDLNAVIKRYALDAQTGNGCNPTPFKITRSVGLQVSTRKKSTTPVNKLNNTLSELQNPEIVDLTATEAVSTPGPENLSAEPNKLSDLLIHQTEVATKVPEQQTWNQNDKKSKQESQAKLLDLETISAMPTPTKTLIQTNSSTVTNKVGTKVAPLNKELDQIKGNQNKVTTFAIGVNTKITPLKKNIGTKEKDATGNAQTKVKTLTNEVKTNTTTFNKVIGRIESAKITNNKTKLRTITNEVESNKTIEIKEVETTDHHKKLTTLAKVTAPSKVTQQVIEIEVIELIDEDVEDNIQEITVKAKPIPSTKTKFKLNKQLTVVHNNKPSFHNPSKPEVVMANEEDIINNENVVKEDSKKCESQNVIFFFFF